MVHYLLSYVPGKSIKILIGAGLPIEKVAEDLGVDTGTVKNILIPYNRVQKNPRPSLSGDSTII